MLDISQILKMNDILRVSIVSQVEHHLYFSESFLCTLCMNVPYYDIPGTSRSSYRDQHNRHLLGWNHSKRYYLAQKVISDFYVLLPLMKVPLELAVFL
jgi:hypothetical protein